ncbi:MAG: HEAT repeat domain-containing protein [Bacteroidia bacterium]|nr:HEAT repeat domain-containing protein [Bacteroidia bacterium]
MQHQDFIDMQMDYLSGNLQEEQRDDFEQYLHTHPAAVKEINALKQSWERLHVLQTPEPSKSMDQNFYAFLDQEVDKQKAEKPTFWGRLNEYLFERKMSVSMGQLAFAISLLLIGIMLGSRMQKGNTPLQQAEAINGSEVEELRTQLVMSLIEQPSASKRLQAVNEANKLSEITGRIIQALLKTLNNDPNANVRLAALESLVQYIDLPEVREGLATSITHQDSPLVQIALADLMVRLQESGSIEEMKKLLQRPEIDKTVKQKIEESILQI